jgi:hypothetical protein
VCRVLQVPIYIFAPEEVLTVADRPDLLQAGVDLQRDVSAAVVLVICVLLLGKLRRPTVRSGGSSFPLSIYGVFALLFIRSAVGWARTSSRTSNSASSRPPVDLVILMIGLANAWTLTGADFAPRDADDPARVASHRTALIEAARRVMTA